MKSHPIRSIIIAFSGSLLWGALNVANATEGLAPLAPTTTGKQDSGRAVIDQIDWPTTGVIDLKKPKDDAPDWTVAELLGKLTTATKIKFQLTPRTTVFNLPVPTPKDAKMAPRDLFVLVLEKAAPYDQPPQWVSDKLSKTVEIFGEGESKSVAVPIRQVDWLVLIQAIPDIFAIQGRDIRTSYIPDLKEDPTGGAGKLELTGPPLWNTKLKVLAERFKTQAPSPPTPEKIPLIFELKYASAADASLKLDRLGVIKNGTADTLEAIPVDGMASRLNKLLGFPPETLQKFTADPRRNAVIIFDTEEKGKTYQQIIDKLDQPRQMVEISASIVDISDRTGLEWQSQFLIEGVERIESRNVPWASGFGATADSGLFGSVADGLPPTGLAKASDAGFTAASLLRGSNYKILNRVRMLESLGQAKVISRPSVLTIDNLPARLTDTTSQFIKVEGERQSQLYDIKTGLEMVVLPRIIPNKSSGDKLGSGTQKIQLLIDLGDGTQDARMGTDTRTSAVEATNRIATQAILTNGESLLIGGRYINQQIEETNSVPILGRIPIVGLAFKNKTMRNHRFQRLYLITPRIITQEELEQRRRHFDQQIEAFPTPIGAPRPPSNPRAIPVPKATNSTTKRFRP